MMEPMPWRSCKSGTSTNAWAVEACGRLQPEASHGCALSKPLEASATLGVAGAGTEFHVEGVRVRRYELAPEALASCASSPAADPAQRCVYPDAYAGAWNASLAYGSDAIITLPHFLLVSSACLVPPFCLMRAQHFLI